jgi:hypothetical protein
VIQGSEKIEGGQDEGAGQIPMEDNFDCHHSQGQVLSSVAFSPHTEEQVYGVVVRLRSSMAGCME